MDRSLINTLVEAIRKADARKTTPYDTQATVTRVENGIAWVHIPGGVDETPVRLTVDAKKGDTVQVRISGGRAHLTGNATAPPTDDTKANKVGANLTATQKVVKAVKATAEKASRIATSTAQYFWVSTGGNDNGAHITAIPQEEFEADPQNGGGNTLLTTNGVAVRDGLTELATFSASGITFGDGTGDVLRFKVEEDFGDRWNVMEGDDTVVMRSIGEYNTTYRPEGFSGSLIANESNELGDTVAGVSIQNEAYTDWSHIGRYAKSDWRVYYVDQNTEQRDSVYITMQAGEDSGIYEEITAHADKIGLEADDIRVNAMKPIVKDTFSDLNVSANTYYYSHTFNIAKSGYTPIALNVRTNQAAVVPASAQFDGSVTVSCRNSTISGLNLYLDVTYARSELL